MSVFTEAFNFVSRAVFENAKAKGFHDKPRSFGDGCALIHGEVSEAFEGYRHGNPPSEHIPAFTAIEEELADTVIRTMDEAVLGHHRVAEAIEAKMLFNTGRSHLHGGKII